MSTIEQSASTEADMDNPNLLFSQGNLGWTIQEGPECQVDSENVAMTQVEGASFTLRFKKTFANHLEIQGALNRTSGAKFNITVDGLFRTFDSSLIDADTSFNGCATVAVITGLSPFLIHNVTITHVGPGVNSNAGIPSVLTINSFAWSHNGSDPVSNIPLIGPGSEDTDAAPTISSKSIPISTSTSPPLSTSAPSTSSPKSVISKGTLIGVVVAGLFLLAFLLFAFLSRRRQLRRIQNAIGKHRWRNNFIGKEQFPLQKSSSTGFTSFIDPEINASSSQASSHGHEKFSSDPTYRSSWSSHSTHRAPPPPHLSLDTTIPPVPALHITPASTAVEELQPTSPRRSYRKPVPSILPDEGPSPWSIGFDEPEIGENEDDNRRVSSPTIPVQSVYADFHRP